MLEGKKSDSQRTEFSRAAMFFRTDEIILKKAVSNLLLLA
jgi:hypothetical protein